MYQNLNDFIYILKTAVIIQMSQLLQLHGTSMLADRPILLSDL